MEAVILAGGLGSRIVEETYLKPKPMVEIGTYPIIWHIMKIYSFYGINKFVICCGYKGYVIKEFFANYLLHSTDVTISMNDNKITLHKGKTEPWEVTLADTGADTMTGGRLKRVKEYIKEKEFCFTYGDGLADINISQLIESHKNSGKLATVTAVKPPGRFGSLEISDTNTVEKFQEKIDGDNSWINGGFFVLNKKVIERIQDDRTSWEAKPLQSLANDNELNAFKHFGFWRPMDTLRDKNSLEELWSKGKAPWKLW